MAQGRDDCVIGGHHIESKTVYRALTIIVIGAVAAFGSAVVVYYNTCCLLYTSFFTMSSGRGSAIMLRPMRTKVSG